MKPILVYLAMAMTALASASDPGEVAVHFLEKIRTNKLNLEPGGDTALSPQTSEPKRQEIARRLKRMSRDLGSGPLEVGAVKLDDDLAAVLVRKMGGFDPSKLQVFPVALVKRGADWAAAPVPASFENTGVGYATVLRQRLASLEDWMLREQALDLAQLREQSADRLRRKISETLPAETLRNLTSKQACERFLTACEARNLPEIFGLLGGLASSLPNDWPLRLTAAESAMTSASEVKPPWRWLISPDVLRTTVHHEENGDTALASIACLDPAGNPPRMNRVGLVHLMLTKSAEDLWRIDLPESFLQEGENPDVVMDDKLDADLLDAFPVKLAEQHPPSAHATAEGCRTALLTAFQEGSLASIVPFIRLDHDPQPARESCVTAAQFWWSLREPSAIRRAVTLGFHEQDHLAAAAVQIFSARNPDHLDLKILCFEKSPDGWFWVPVPTPKMQAAYGAWADLQTPRWQQEWQDAVLAGSFPLENIPDLSPPTADESRKLIGSWLQSIRAGDMVAALRLTARLNRPDSKASLLRNLGYELTGARNNPQSPTITGVDHGAIFSTVGTRTLADGKPSFPIYPIIATPAGPRLLLEIDWVAGGGRSRDFLNKEALERLRKASPAAADELSRLFSMHQAPVNPPSSP